MPTSQYISFTGTLLNCNGAPVTNGYVSMYTTGGVGYYVITNAIGVFSFSIVSCAGTNLSYSYQGTDNATNQQNALLTGSTNGSGLFNLGNIIACGANSSSDVYVAGWEAGKAKFWKNGISTELSDGTIPANAYSIFISQANDIYVAGVAYGGAKVWKNGQPYNSFTPSTNSTANSIFLNGTDVYVAGAFKTGASFIFTPKLWKNNILFPMITSNQNDSYANSVFVSGADVYVAGSENNTAVFWKNGVETYLANINPSNFGSFAFSIFIYGTDVYIAGIEGNGVNNVAKFWKNGIGSNLSDGTYSAYAKSVFVSNGDVYVAGYEKNQSGFYVAKFWKNGIVTSVTNGVTNAYATGIFVKGTDVYVCGKEINSSGMSVAKFWKNSLPTNLTFGAHVDEQANSIFVK